MTKQVPVPAQPGAWLAWAQGLPLVRVHLWACVQLFSEEVWRGAPEGETPLVQVLINLLCPSVCPRKTDLLPVTGVYQS